MKAKIIRGKGFRGVLNYVFDEGIKKKGEKLPEIVGGTCNGQDAASCSAEFQTTRQLRPDVERPVWHCSLSLPPNEKINNGQWNDIAHTFMSKMKFPPDTIWTAVRHHDTDHDHIHIVASRISLSKKLWLGEWDVHKAIKATNELEREMGLTITPTLDTNNKKPNKNPTFNEIQKASREGSDIKRLTLQGIITELLQQYPQISAPDFVKELAVFGVEARPNIASTGRMNGFSFSYEGSSFTGKQLGDRYTWKNLQKDVSYEQARDYETLISIKNSRNQPTTGNEPEPRNPPEKNRREARKDRNLPIQNPHPDPAKAPAKTTAPAKTNQPQPQPQPIHGHNKENRKNTPSRNSNNDHNAHPISDLDRMQTIADLQHSAAFQLDRAFKAITRPPTKIPENNPIANAWKKSAEQFFNPNVHSNKEEDILQSLSDIAELNRYRIRLASLHNPPLKTMNDTTQMITDVWLPRLQEKTGFHPKTHQLINFACQILTKLGDTLKAAVNRITQPKITHEPPQHERTQERSGPSM